MASNSTPFFKCKKIKIGQLILEESVTQCYTEEKKALSACSHAKINKVNIDAAEHTRYNVIFNTIDHPKAAL